MENNLNKSAGMLPSRLEALSDAIFAFAMTLLVLSINLPQAGKDFDITSYLINQLPNFWNFAISFLILAFLWVNLSQQFHHIKRTSSGLIMLTIFMLLFVVLLPFSTSLLNDFPKEFTSELFFNLNMFILACLFALNWQFALRSACVEYKGEEEHFAIVNRKQYIFPALSLLAVIITFFAPGWSTLSYLLTPVLIYSPLKK